MPEGISGAGASGANVGVAVVAVDAPGMQHALVIDKFVPRTPDMVHDLVLTSLLQSQPDARGQVVQNFIPADALPLPFSALAGSLHGIQNAFRIIDLIERRWALRTVAATAAGMSRIPFEFMHLHLVFVDVGQQTAGSFAIETNR